MGVKIAIKAFGATVIGGIGNLSGAALGAFIIAEAETLTAGYVSSDMRDLVAFVILILILTIKPDGLLGKKCRRRCDEMSRAKKIKSALLLLLLAAFIVMPFLGISEYVLRVLILCFLYSILAGSLNPDLRHHRTGLDGPRSLLRHRRVHLGPALHARGAPGLAGPALRGVGGGRVRTPNRAPLPQAHRRISGGGHSGLLRRWSACCSST